MILLTLRADIRVRVVRPTTITYIEFIAAQITSYSRIPPRSICLYLSLRPRDKVIDTRIIFRVLYDRVVLYFKYSVVYKGIVVRSYRVKTVYKAKV